MPEKTFLRTSIFLYKPALQDNWPHSHYLSLPCTCRTAPGSLRRRNDENYYYVFKHYLASVCTRLVVLNVVRILHFIW